MLPVLEEKAAQGQTEGTADGLDQMSLNMPPGLLEEDWDFMVSTEQSPQTCPALTIHIR